MKTFFAATAFVVGMAGSVAAEECDKILDTYEFCAGKSWHRAYHPAFPEGMYIWKTKGGTAKLLIEPASVGEHLETDMVIDAIKDRVTMSLPEGISANFIEHSFVDGAHRSLGTISYDIQDSENTFRTHHSVIVTEDHIMQYVTIKPDVDDEVSAETHWDFVSRFKEVAADYDL